MEFVSKKSLATAIGIAAIGMSSPSAAKDADAGGRYVRPAVGADIFVSDDSDDTEIVRAGFDLDFDNKGDNDRLGVRLEKAWYEPAGQEQHERERVFLQAGQEFGDWQARGRIGTDMHSVIGSVSINDMAALRKEFFIERDIVETQMGLDDTPIYSTFAGAAIDLPVDDHNVFNVLAGYQDFTGDNERYHLRGTYIHVVKPSWGLSAQLRARYFHSTEPGEYDYYSPKNYLQVLPAVQVRRFFGEGWMVQAVGAIGAQRDSSSGWERSHFGQIRMQSPRGDYDWSVNGEITYTDTPSGNSTIGSGYSYVQALFGVTRRF
ncbi:hypothetical protein [Croceicoccus gelatinilyticus]|uniref:hypothetical protein n=1 Tax=Croceicoccus gelatinilyticus TaxID=2835536 RepID=UPI001BCFE001|nr:hypothetical protein [Croceicoccus gelatinilyticus]MBS7671439.1 hypothetical protein [Croceicoccus gelatinilyticus]